MTDFDPSLQSFRARQMVAELSGANQAILKIETEEGAVMVRMERSVLEEFFHRNEALRLSLLKTPEKFEET
jgi:hypothetical protein